MNAPHDSIRQLRTVSGIRGEVKKSHVHDEPGGFRATFEDKILMSDIVFCRLWVPVQPAEFYNPVTSLLAAPDAHVAPSDKQAKGAGGGAKGSATDAANATRAAWAEQAGEVPGSRGQGKRGGAGDDEDEEEDEELDDDEDGGELDDNDEDDEDDEGRLEKGLFDRMEMNGGEGEDEIDDGDNEEEQSGGVALMRTVAELRREASVPVPVNKDSLYKPIERTKRTFNPIPIPKSLEAALPFASKSKNLAPKSKNKKGGSGGGGGGYVARREAAVVMEPRERKRIAFLNTLGTIRNDKKAKRKASRAEKKEEKAKKRAKVEEHFAGSKAAEAKKRHRAAGLELKARQYAAEGGGGKGRGKKKGR